MRESIGPKLCFKYPFGEREAYEAQSRGYLGFAFVELCDGRHFPVVFYDPIRLQQDLEVEVAEGRPFLAEPGMIVLPEITPENMDRAINRLWQEGFFSTSGESAASVRRTAEELDLESTLREPGRPRGTTERAGK